ncbi:hypothetical protein JXA32_08485 [Candidatus Sumerlaeota bacterium]|nr:hypothetical protein [Candidatus Sumerlaeota bacterium]
MKRTLQIALLLIGSFVSQGCLGGMILEHYTIEEDWTPEKIYQTKDGWIAIQLNSTYSRDACDPSNYYGSGMEPRIRFIVLEPELMKRIIDTANELPLKQNSGEEKSIIIFDASNKHVSVFKRGEGKDINAQISKYPQIIPPEFKANGATYSDLPDAFHTDGVEMRDFNTRNNNPEMLIVQIDDNKYILDWSRWEFKSMRSHTLKRGCYLAVPAYIAEFPLDVAMAVVMIPPFFAVIIMRGFSGVP